MDDERLQQLVTRFYLRMMRLNALEGDDGLLEASVETGRAASKVGDALRLGVMGAWFAVLHDDEEIEEAVLASLASSAGSRTSPPLAVVAVTLRGPGALEALERYASQDIAQQ